MRLVTHYNFFFACFPLDMMSKTNGPGARLSPMIYNYGLHDYTVQTPSWLKKTTGVIIRPPKLCDINLYHLPPPSTPALEMMEKEKVRMNLKSVVRSLPTHEKRHDFTFDAVKVQHQLAEVLTKLKLDTNAPDFSPLFQLAETLGNSLQLKYALELLPFNFLKFLKSKLGWPKLGEHKGTTFIRDCLTSDIMHSALQRSVFEARLAYMRSVLPASLATADVNLTATTVPPPPPKKALDAVALLTVFTEKVVIEPRSRQIDFLSHPSFVIRELDIVEQSHPSLHLINQFTAISHPGYNKSSTVPSLSQFQDNFYEFTGGLLRGVELSSNVRLLFLLLDFVTLTLSDCS